uniref:DUF6382 domain-containing protein n=1 Tax=Agathobacter sp. TaxID=2021311 RepID=UPI004057C2A3
MNFTFENQGTNTYMVYRIGEMDEIDSMSLGMITNNKISGLAPAFYYQQDTAKYIKYNVSAKVTADQFLMGVVNKKRLTGVFFGIVHALLSAEEYMIDADSILLDLKYIYTDVSTCETLLICLPVQKENCEHVDLKLFLKNIVFSTQFDQTENCDYIAKLINYLNSASAFSLTEFKEILDEINGLHTVALSQTMSSQAVQERVYVRTEAISEADLVQKTAGMQNVREPASFHFVQPTAAPARESASFAEQTAVLPQASIAPQPVSKTSETTSASGFAIPGQGMAKPEENKKKKAEKQKEKETSAAGEKEISFWYLMQHYNRENAVAYKAQKEAKKAKKETEKEIKKETKKKGNKAKPESNRAIPEQTAEANTQVNTASFSIPGQEAGILSGISSVQNVTQNYGMASNPQSCDTTFQEQNNGIASRQPASMYCQQTVQTYGGTANFGETTILSQGNVGETMVLDAGMLQTEAIPHLVRQKNNEKILLDKPIFRIGKERSYVDYFIGDNTAISRSHANVVAKNGEYFVVDTNSTNHTYVDGMMIQSNVEVKLTHGTKLRLANEEFEFRLN